MELSQPQAQDLRSQLAAKIAGQPKAIESIATHIDIHAAGLAPKRRPVGIFLLLGPTGTGKTRTVEAVSEVLHGGEEYCLKINCAEFCQSHERAKLIGAPPGYVGHGEGAPRLAQSEIDKRRSAGSPLTVVLFDEIEKASEELRELLLGIFDKGELTLGNGAAVNFEKTLIFCTSNLGAHEMMRELQPGFGFREKSEESLTGIGDKLERIAAEACRKAFSPEFINRFDAVITFQPLSETAVHAILDNAVAELQAQLDEKGHHLWLALMPDARDLLLRKGMSREYGARALRRTFREHVSNPVARAISAGRFAPGGDVRIALTEDGQSVKLQFRAATRSTAQKQGTVAGTAAPPRSPAAESQFPSAEVPVANSGGGADEEGLFSKLMRFTGDVIEEMVEQQSIERTQRLSGIWTSYETGRLCLIQSEQKTPLLRLELATSSRLLLAVGVGRLSGFHAPMGFALADELGGIQAEGSGNLNVTSEESSLVLRISDARGSLWLKDRFYKVR